MLRFQATNNFGYESLTQLQLSMEQINMIVK